MLPRDEADQPEAPKAPPCAVPGCKPPDDARALIWGGRRLCYPHMADFSVHPLSEACSQRGKGPTAEEWEQFVSGVDRRAA